MRHRFRYHPAVFIFLIAVAFQLCTTLARSAAATPLFPPMDNGALEAKNRPFDYFAYPTTVIGVKDGTYGAEITPEGYIYTGDAELGFFVGGRMTPVNQRVKTLEDGWLPVVHTRFSFEGLNYDITYFASTVDDKPDGEMICFARVGVSNPGKDAMKAVFWAGQRFEGPDHRVQAHAKREMVGFQPPWLYAMEEDYTLRGGKIVYMYPPNPTRRFIQPNVEYTKSGERIRIPKMYPQDWVNIVQYVFELKPGASRVLNFRMPFKPANPGFAETLRAIDIDLELKSTKDFWRNELASAAQIEVPEDKVNNAYRANLVYLLIARAKTGDDYVQKVNKFQYDWFWLRDASFILMALDQFGFHLDAARGARYFRKFQNKEGNYESQRGQLDGFGQTLWLFGSHYELTKDLAFLREVYPGVRHAMAWLTEARSQEKARLKEGDLGYGLMPVSSPGDNEQINGHVIGHDLWGLTGVKKAIMMAHALGEVEDERRFEAEYRDYHYWLMINLEKVAARTGGYITPAVEPGGYDWGNLKLVWPAEELDPWDSKVTATMQMAHKKFAEGLMTYQLGTSLHHYITIDVAQTDLIRGEWDKIMETFYALLVHTSSTHGGFEWKIAPWGNRDYGTNLAPHGCFAGKYLLLYRNMFVREQGRNLHLLSGLSPVWLKPGSTVAFRNGSTAFGDISFEMHVDKAGADISIRPPQRDPFDQMVLHFPPFLKVVKAYYGAEWHDVTDNIVTAPPQTSFVKVQWERSAAPDYSYDSAVRDYLSEYNRRVTVK